MPSSDTPILLSTLNARYSHCAFGLRYLYANLGDLQSRARIAEFTIAQNPRDIVERLLSFSPRIIGFGVYIWNTAQTLEVVSLLKRVAPQIVIVLGGPEVSHEADNQALCGLADHTIQGEADLLFAELCRALLADPTESEALGPPRFIRGELPELRRLALPYRWYTADDILHRVIYVEASRGCPYRCEYCLSSLDKSVRGFDLDLFLAEMQALLDRGARSFKFVDRTFNLSIATSQRILRFFLGRAELGLFLHFEMVPDRLPLELRELVRRFPRGSLQFEIGIQTWNPETAALVSRRQDYTKIGDNLRFLRDETGVHIHADLIAGLPGEDAASFARGFDALAALSPHEIQLGILKRLKGTPIIRHDRQWQMVYHDHPPFQVLRTGSLGFVELQEIGRFARYWDVIANSGGFSATLDILRERALVSGSLYVEFMALTRFLSARHPQGNGVALLGLVESVWLYLTESAGCDHVTVRAALVSDYARGHVRRDIPLFLRETAGSDLQPHRGPRRAEKTVSTPARQLRHQAGYQAGGSLAGKDSQDASSTWSGRSPA